MAEYLEEYWGAKWGEVPQTTVVGRSEGQLRLAINDEASRVRAAAIPQKHKAAQVRKRLQGTDGPDLRAPGALLP
ncbi:MAG: hypothetical protein VX686_02905, partial [Candidatus Thermoplasmatota archaeon]|nr:hypothetical protein [Candidatus Thermoplasmatota archaeon]